MTNSGIQVIQGDITTLAVDAIVTAANESLCGGGGVDGAIHAAAGPGLVAECQGIGLCPEGEARITGGHQLAAKFIIHTVGPVWEGGSYGEAETLRSCYQATLALAKKNGIPSIAFPCIATGSYQFPREQACAIAISSVEQWLSKQPPPQQVIFCCFEDEDFRQAASPRQYPEKRLENWGLAGWQP